ncbi:MAG TPA: class I SAM-dependent methyltransferase [bacterium]|nr:class I SAM-dependent methyltransferase [bacterium]
MSDQSIVGPEHTAVRVALWRAIHVQVDPAPHVLEDLVGLKLVNPDEDWRKRPDMDPQFTKIFRGSIVARARFIEDLAVEQAALGVNQYVILGAGLDSFAQRRPETASQLNVFEVDQPSPQEWKRQRLMETGYGVPEWLKLVPFNFEAGGSWLDKLADFSFEAKRPAVVVSTGVSMYLTKEAVLDTLRQMAKLAPGSTFAMTYILPMEQAEPEERFGREIAEKGARASGTPFISFFVAEEIVALAREAGFKKAQTVSAAMLAQRYFAGRKDGLKPSKSEELLLATT